MMPSGLLYRSARALNTASKCSSTRSSLPSALGSIRSFTISRPLLKNHDLPGHNDENQGTMARTDKQVQIEHPKEENYPSSKPFQGSGGKHLLRTLAGFSLEGRVAIITGGARGLGLVMAQALVISGADVALVDLNSILSITFGNLTHDTDKYAYRGGMSESSRQHSPALYRRKSGCRTVRNLPSPLAYLLSD